MIVPFVFFLSILLLNTLTASEAKIDVNTNNIYKEKERANVGNSTTVATNDGNSAFSNRPSNPYLQHQLKQWLGNTESTDANTCNKWSDFSLNIDSSTQAAGYFKCVIPERMLGPESVDRANTDLAEIFKRLAPCSCEAVSTATQMSINVSNIYGQVAIQHICNNIDNKAPITTAECQKFNSRLFSALMNMSLEITSKDVICNLVSGECGTTLVPDKAQPMNCTFCNLLHKKAHSITSNFSALLDTFKLMCNRLKDDEKTKCDNYVDRLGNKMKELLDLNFSDSFAKEYACKKIFKCKE